MNQPKLTAERLARKALVYIRQVDVIDEDLGRTGSGQVERPGFPASGCRSMQRRSGHGLCLEASRLARNGRDWHHLIELCGMVSAVLIDFD